MTRSRSGIIESMEAASPFMRLVLALFHDMTEVKCSSPESQFCSESSSSGSSRWTGARPFLAVGLLIPYRALQERPLPSHLASWNQKRSFLSASW